MANETAKETTETAVAEEVVQEQTADQKVSDEFDTTKDPLDDSVAALLNEFNDEPDDDDDDDDEAEEEVDEAEEEAAEEADVDEDGNVVLTQEAYDRFMAERNELASMKMGGGEQAAAPKEEAEGKEPEPAPSPVVFDANEIKPPEISEEEFEEIATDPAKFAAYIHKAQSKAIEHVMRALPGLMLPTVVSQTYQSNLVFRFMRENPGLAPYQNAVIYSMMEAYNKKPDASEEEIFEMVRTDVAGKAKKAASIRKSKRVDRRSKRGRFSADSTGARTGRRVAKDAEEVDPTDEAFGLLVR